MSKRDIAAVLAERLQRQRLTAVRADTPHEAATHMLAMQGQDLASVMWSIALRTGSSTSHVSEASVRQAFDDRELVRAWPMRGTLHAMASEDLGWMLSLTRERMLALAAGRHRDLGITPADVSLAQGVTETALAATDGVRRSHLVELFGQSGLGNGQRINHLIYHLAYNGVICYGPFDGREQLLVSARDWIRSSRDLGRDEALAELTTRYFRSHGPASESDLAWWAGITLSDVRRGIAANGDHYREIVVGGRTLLTPDDDTPRSSGTPMIAAPGFDETMLGYRDRSLSVPAEHMQRIVPGNNGMFMSTILDRGHVLGTWRRTERAHNIVIEPHPFGAFPASARSRFDRAAGVYGAFRGIPVMITDPLS